MNGYYYKQRYALRNLSWVLFLVLGLSGPFLVSPYAAIAQEEPLQEATEEDPEKEESSQEEAVKEEPEPLTWARVDFIRNRVQLVPRDQSGRRANVSDILRLGDRLRTARASRAELRFNDGSLARIGERATFRFTPNTRNFQLSNGTILLLIPPGRGRSTIQTPNAVTGIQGSALFVRYIPETDTTIVGALTNNPEGPMVLYNRDGTEQQALRANEIGVIEGDQITELYQFDGTLFWQSSGLAEGFNYLPSPTSTDELDGVREEIREAISSQGRLDGDSVITNPDSFKAPDTGVEDDINIDIQEQDIEFEGSPAEDYQRTNDPVDEQALEIGVNNSLQAAVEEEDVAITEVDTTGSEGAGATAEEESADANQTENDATDSETSTSTGNDASAGTASSSESPQGGASEGAGASESNAPQGTNDAGDASVEAPDTDVSDVAPSDVAPSDVDNPDVGASDVEGTVTNTPSELGNEAVNAGDLDTSPSGVGDVTSGPSASDIDASESVGADIPTPDVPDSAAPNDIGVNTEDITVPDLDAAVPSAGDSPISSDPAPEPVNQLNDTPIHDFEMHGPDGTSSGEGAGAVGTGASAAGGNP